MLKLCVLAAVAAANLILDEFSVVGGLPTMRDVIAAAKKGGYVRGARKGKCPVTFDIHHVQDQTGSFTRFLTTVHSTMKEILETTQQTWPGSRIAFSQFADKPMPYVGTGDFGDFPKKYNRDLCFTNVLPLTGDIVRADSVLRNLSGSGGGDWHENVYGGIISALTSPHSGFATTIDKKGATKGVIKVLLIVTDAPSHQPGDLLKACTNWNNDLGTPRMDDGQTRWMFRYGRCDVKDGNYKRMMELRPKYDAGTLKGDEVMEWEDLVALCGPFVDLSKIRAHPGQSEDSAEDCVMWDYPSIEQVKDAFDSHTDVMPVFVSMGPNAGLPVAKWYLDCPNAKTEADCVSYVHRKAFVDAGITRGAHYAAQGGLNHFKDIIFHIMDQLQAFYDESGCILPTEEPTQPPTTTSPQTLPPTAPTTTKAPVTTAAATTIPPTLPTDTTNVGTVSCPSINDVPCF
ncbi:MAG: hypothetical protein KVP17_000107 [Porospora cf. gigantea B]|uniref:uncharacterized protein n=1 Tax=Porospora cf. gigantea B TaxID=2853592 RepID=UPI003571B6D8|nr:MAG: hypothetical protein KVP17_000107 [Porospora cf. gigantea B]